MSASTAPIVNFSRPLSSTVPHPSITTTTPSHSLRSASSSQPSQPAPSPAPAPPLPSSSTTTFFTPTDSLDPPSSPHVSKARASKTAGTTGLGIGRPEKEKPRGGGFGAPGTGTAARGPSRKRSRVDLAGEAKEEREAAGMSSGGAGRLVPQDEKAGFDNAIEFDPDQDGEDDDEDDEGGGKKSRSASGAANARRKIQISYIEDKARRHITFSKRKAGIMKKAFELSTLTGTQVLLLVVSETGLVYTFTTSKLQPLVTREEGKNLIQACLNAPNGEGPDGGPSGDGGMTTGARAVKGGNPGAPIRHKDDSTPYNTIPMPPIPMPDSPESEDPHTPTSSSAINSRRPSAALPRRGRAVSTAVSKSKKAQQAAAVEAANSNEFDLEDEDQHGGGALSEMARGVLEAQEAQKREALRLRGMDFLVGDEDDGEDQEMGLNGLGGMGMGGGGGNGARSMSGIAPTHINPPPVSTLYSNDIRSPTLGGLQQYDDYSTQDLVSSSKLDEQDDDQMQHYLSTSAASSSIPPPTSSSSSALQQTSSSSSSSSGLPGHHQQQQQHHISQHQQQQHLSPHLQHHPSPPPTYPSQQQHHQQQQRQQQQQHMQNQQMNYGQYSTHMHQQQQQFGGGQGGFSPGHHQALSPSGTTGYDGGGYGGQGGGGGGGAFGSQSGAGW